MISIGSKWICKQDGEGRGHRHTVVDYTGGWLITWSDPSQAPEMNGWTWFGPESAFLMAFSPA